MRRGATLPFVLVLGGLTGCGASVSQAERDATALHARAEADREHARLLEIEARLLEMEQRLASQPRACETPSVLGSADGAGSDEQTQPLRSEGDFSTQARVVTAPRGVAQAVTPLPAKVAAATHPQTTTPASERERLEQLLEGLREYASDPKLSVERREALRVLLRRERKLDLLNPWGDQR